MLYTLAHRLLSDLDQAAVVVGPDDQILVANQAFQGYFYESSPDGHAMPSPELLKALTVLGKSESQKNPHVTPVFRHQNRSFQLSVYFLNNAAGEAGVRLILATPMEIEDRNKGAAQSDQGQKVPKLSPAFSSLIGRDPSFLQALRMAQRSAQTDLPVLILGESGTGKEILARTIHQASRRHKKAFVDVNCAAIPDSLVESELFGYEKGAFTGASPSGKRGFFEIAHQGSIFMDEIGDAASQTQAKLLRVLESGQYKRVGGNRNINVDVRLIAATNQELSQRIVEGKFRSDLLYRINTITIRLSPLRERLGDLPLLVDHFLGHGEPPGKGKLQFSGEAMQILYAYSWPGNVRELKGVVDYAMAMAEGVVLTSRNLPRFLMQPAAREDTRSPMLPAAEDFVAHTDLLAPVVEQAERHQIQRVLQKSRTRSEAILRLGISRRTFYAKIKQYGLD